MTTLLYSKTVVLLLLFLKPYTIRVLMKPLTCKKLMKKEREKPMPGVVLFVVLYLSLVLTMPFTKRLILLII